MPRPERTDAEWDKLAVQHDLQLAELVLSGRINPISAANFANAAPNGNSDFVELMIGIAGEALF